MQCSFLPAYQRVSWCVLDSSVSGRWLRTGDQVTYTIRAYKYTNPSPSWLFISSICFPDYFQCYGAVSCTVNGVPAAGSNGSFATPTSVRNQYFDLAGVHINEFTFTAVFTLSPTITYCHTSPNSVGATVGCSNPGREWWDKYPINIAPHGVVEQPEKGRNRQRKFLYFDRCTGTNRYGDSYGETDLGGGLGVAYNSAESSAPPASLGWGWSLPGVNQHIVEDPSNLDMVFYDGAGGGERWKKMPDGTYQPRYPDNYASLTLAGGLFKITTKEKVQLNFRSDGKLSTVVDRNANTTTYAYDGSARLTSISDSEGRATFFGYGSRTDGQPVSIRQQNATTGRLTTLDYHANGRLWKVTDPAGEINEFLYDANNLLWKHIDPRGKTVVEYTYASGKVATSTHFGELKRSFSYASGDNDSGIVTVVEEDLTLAPNTDPRTSVLTFDKRGLLTKRVDPLNNVWVDEYNDSGSPYLLTARIDPNGQSTRYSYDSTGNLTAVLDAQGNTTSIAYVEGYLPSEIQRPAVTVDNQVVTYAPTRLTYNTTGNLLRVKDTLNGVDLETVYTVRSDGRIATMTDRRGKVTSFDYTTQSSTENAGNLKKITSPAGPNGAPAREVLFEYDLYDNLKKVTDPAGNHVDYQFDDNNRLTKVTDALSQYVDFSYLNGLLDYVELPANQGSASNRRRTRFTRDNPGRVLQVLSKISTSQEQMRVRHEYDGRSNLKKLARLKNSVEKAHQFTHDALNRPTQALDPLSRATSIAWQPFCTEHTVTDAKGLMTTYSRDSLCRLVEIRSSDELQVLDYDELGRLISVEQTHNPGEARYSTNPPGPNPARFGQARFAGTTSLVETTKYLYDALDRLVKVTYPGNKTVLFEYDAEGHLTKLTDVLGNVTEYTYYDDGRLYQVIVKRPPGADQVFTYSYDLAGRLAEIQYPTASGIVAKFSDTLNNSGWNANGQLTHLRYLKSGAHLHSFQYAYDDSGNRKQLIDKPQNTANQVTWDFSYDWLNRLTNVSRNSVLHSVYLYDESDNRTELQLPVLGETHTYAYDNANQIVSRSVNSVSAETFTHDANGNMATRTAGGVTTTYNWNAMNKLVGITKSGVTDTYKYDSRGIRKQKNTDIKFYSGAMSLNDTKPSGDLAYVQGHQLLAVIQGGNLHYLLAEAQANVRLVVDATGAVVASYSHDEFGKQESATGGADLLGHTFQGALGVRNDWSTSGLHLAGQRFYDPSLGRWLNADPIGFNGGLNLYAAMANNPVTFVDPDGMEVGYQYPAPGVMIAPDVGDPSRVTGNAAAIGTAALAVGLGMILRNPRAAWQAAKGAFLRDPITATNGIGGAGYGVLTGDPNSPFPCPTLPKGDGPSMFKKAMGVLRNAPTNQRANLAEQLLGQVKANSTTPWTASRMTAPNGASVWIGELGETLVVESSGRMLRGHMNDIQWGTGGTVRGWNNFREI